MSKNRLFTIFVALLSFALFSGNSNAVYDNYTGSPASSGTCNNCHGGGSTNNGSLTLTSNIGAAYVHGQTYQITVYLSDPDMAKAGFQLSAIDDMDMGVGTFNPIANTALFGVDPSIINHAPAQLTPTHEATWI